MSKKKNYRIFEGLRIATCLTFVSGFLNAFTFITQGGRFAGIQSGNVVYMAFYLAQGQFYQSFQFLVPIIFFALGQCFTYLMRRHFVENKWPWHFSSSMVIFTLVLFACLLNPILGPSMTIAILAFAASIQVESFRNIRGLPYANVMMTGNVKNAAHLWFKGMVEKDAQLRKKGYHILLIIFTFMLGVCAATFLVSIFQENALIFCLCPLLYINVQLWKEKQPSKN
ncbi:DUF1275 domain-containing protein [Streptococcus gallolyticus]|uniref:YoaK family protein n=1 Tax=Streptococcus hepaticus TaxID=3349163 RepID=UPI001C980B2F|nr:DUF1275 domain-containing protein [Streptococcus gallolyticus]MBY5040798.1 DUF1275 domain-containing protein [Streptococcus gallolyticus]